VPTITMEGDANGAPHPEPASYASMFSGKYAHRTIEGGIGHNLPQEAPRPSPKPSSTSRFDLVRVRPTFGLEVARPPPLLTLRLNQLILCFN
jgi:hypothetical protein